MKDHTGCKRAFAHTGAAYYADAVRSEGDSVHVGYYHPEGGTTGEFSVRWVPLGATVAPRLEAFDDSWSALAQFGDVLAQMAEHDSENMTPEAFCALLVSCGVEDITKRERPTS